jgi:hypothetical protein
MFTLLHFVFVAPCALTNAIKNNNTVLVEGAVGPCMRLHLKLQPADQRIRSSKLKLTRATKAERHTSCCVANVSTLEVRTSRVYSQDPHSAVAD